MTSIASRCFAFLLFLLASGGSEPVAFEFTEVHMGLPVRLVLHAGDRQIAEPAARAAFARIAVLDRMMSDYRPDSELRRVDSRVGTFVPVSPELLAVLTRAL